MHTFTPSQASAFARFKAFLEGPGEVFLLKGAAGTGKTTLLKAFLAHLASLSRRTMLTAPTGRAAHVLGLRTGAEAMTTHSGIYAFEACEEIPETGERLEEIRLSFCLRADPPLAPCVVIVDEASMVGDQEVNSGHLRFGSGRLLRDLVQFTFGQGKDSGNKLLLVGDHCQLPPVGQPESPALSADYLQREFGLSCEEVELTEILRQEADSPILREATRLRTWMDAPHPGPPGCRLPSIQPVQAVRSYVESHQGQGQDSTVLLCHTNQEVFRFNRDIRSHLFPGESTVCAGDRLLVVENNPRLGLLNGETVEVLHVSPDQELVRMRGKELTLRRLQLRHFDAHGRPQEQEVMIVEDLLHSRERSLTREQRSLLYADFKRRHPQLRQGSGTFTETLLKDVRFNALRVKFGYAMTVHKSQGGEWPFVILNRPTGSLREGKEIARWLYTAVTRAQAQLLFIDCPSFGIHAPWKSA